MDATGSHISILDPKGQLTTWDLSGQAPKRSQTRLQTRPSATAFSGDGKTIAVASRGWNSVVEFADLTRRLGELKLAEGDSLEYSKLAFSPDGAFLAASGCKYPLAGDCNLTILDVWDIPKRTLIQQESHSLNGLIDAIAWFSNERIAAGGRKAMSQDGLIAVWRVQPDAPAPIIFRDAQSGIVNGLAFISQGAVNRAGHPMATRLLYSADRSSDIQLLDAIMVQQKLKPWTGHTGGLNALVRSTDDGLVATASSDRTARIWDVAGNQESFTLPGHTEEVQKIAFSGDRRRLVTLGRDQKMKVWNLEPNGEIASQSSATLVSLSGDGRFAIMAGGQGSPQVVDLIRNSAEPLPQAFNVSSISGDGRLVAGAAMSGDIDIYDRKSRQKLRSANCPRFILRLQFAAGTERLLIACEAEPILWDIGSAHNLKLPAFTPKGSVVAEAISRDGQFVAFRDEGAIVTVVNVAAGTSLKMSAKSRPNSDLAFSPDDKLLAGSSPEGNVVLFDTSSGRLVRNFSGHAGPATAFAFSNDGKLLATGGADKLTKIWDLATGQEQLSLTGHTAPVSKLAFSPDRKRLTTVAANGEVLVYALDFRDLVAIARTRVTRRLTSAECVKFLHGQCPATQ